jgi:TPR repeat protein
MAPEQATGAGVDARSDVYGLGAVLYHAATGSPPYAGRSAMAVLQALAKGAPPSPREVRPELEPELERLLLKAMARDPTRRYPNAASLAADLRRLERGEALSHSDRRGALALGAAGALVVAAVLGVGLAWSGRPQPSAPAPAPSTRPEPPASPRPSPEPQGPPRPSLREELQELSRAVERLHQATPEPGLTFQLKDSAQLIEDALQEDDLPLRSRALGKLGGRMHRRQEVLAEPLGYTPALILRVLEAGAAGGEASALYELARYLLNRKAARSPESLARAEATLRASAKAGYTIAMRTLGERLIRSSSETDVAEGVRWLGEAADGDYDAKVTLARVLIGYREFVDTPHLNVTRGLSLLEEATAGGDRDGAALLAYVYMEGHHIERDPAKAADALRKATARGRNEELLPDLGDVLRMRGAAECVDVYERGLARLDAAGRRRCHLGLATWYRTHGTDPAQRLDQLERAATLGDRDAALEAAWLRRLSGDDDAAGRWQQRASRLPVPPRDWTPTIASDEELQRYLRELATPSAEHDPLQRQIQGWAQDYLKTPMAQDALMLGRMMLGEDFGQWPAEMALALLRRAADEGHPAAAFHLAQRIWSHERHGDARRDRHAECLRYYRRAAETGPDHERAGEFYTAYALSLPYGNDDPAVDREATEWLRRGAEAGDKVGMREWARALLQGEHVRQDVAAAERWVERAAEAGEYGAYTMLADHYLDGERVPRDVARARDLYRRAVDEGGDDEDRAAWGQFLIQHGEPDEAEAGRQQLAIAFGEGSARAGRWLAEHLRELGRLQEALEWARKAEAQADWDAGQLVRELEEALGQ